MLQQDGEHVMRGQQQEVEEENRLMTVAQKMDGFEAAEEDEL